MKEVHRHEKGNPKMMTITPMETNEPSGITIQITATLSLNAEVARRMVNVELMRKVGQLVITGEPELLIEGEQAFWKMPLFVASPVGDDNIYPLKPSALVDAISGMYIMDAEFVEAVKEESLSIIQTIYPKQPRWGE
jgi:hypothetical protein